MGFSVSWIGVQGASKEDVLTRLNLIDTGRPDPESRARLACATLPSGWTVIYSNRFDYASPQRIAAASAGAFALGCAVEEHVMFSEAWAYRDGEAVWRVSHDCEKGLYDLTVVGELSAQAEAVRARLIGEQDEAGGEKADVDHVFEIPIEIAATVCGFRHDALPVDGEPVFTELEQTLPPRAPGKGILQMIGSLFGRS